MQAIGKTPEQADFGLDLSAFLDPVVDYKIALSAIVLSSLLVAVTIWLLTEKTFRADALLLLEKQNIGVVSLGKISETLSEDTPVNKEIEILNSRKILSGVIENLNLDIEVVPARSSILSPVANEGDGPKASPRDPSSGQTESISISELSVPTAYLGIPITVAITGVDTFEVSVENMTNSSNTGRIGAKTSVANASITLDTIHANVGAKFLVTKRSMLESIQNLREKLRIDEAKPGSGLLRLTLDGSDATIVSRVANEIISVYRFESNERKNQQAIQALSFVEAQLPLATARQHDAELALNEFREKTGAIDLSKETQEALEQITALEAQRSILLQRKEELAQKFTEQHVRIVAIDDQLRLIRSQVRALDRKAQKFPDQQQTVLRLSRELEAANQLKSFLQTRVQELQLAGSQQTDQIKIIDDAVPPEEPIAPKLAPLIGLALFVGLTVGYAMVFMAYHANAKRKRRCQPCEALAIPIRGYVPKQAETDQTLLELAMDTDGMKTARKLAVMLGLDYKSNMRVIAFSSIDAQAATYSLAIRLASILAHSGRDVVLIDADLDNGHLGGEMIEQSINLADLLRADSDLLSTVILNRHPVYKMKLLPNGASTGAHTSPSLLRDAFSTLISNLSQKNDHIIIVAPPVTTSLEIAAISSVVDSTLLVAPQYIENSIALRQVGRDLELCDFTFDGAVQIMG